MRPTFLIVLLFLLPTTGLAGLGTVSCHCFRHRSYDPAHRFASDDYLVATTFNTLIARNFHISKRRIVMWKMQGGIAPADLLIGLYLAQRSGRDPDLLFSVRENGGTWQQIMHSCGLEGRDADPVLRALARGTGAGQVATLITDSMIRQTFALAPDLLEQLRAMGFNGRQITVICALAKQGHRPPRAIAAMYQEKKMSWSEIAARFHLTPREVGKILAYQETEP